MSQTLAQRANVHSLIRVGPRFTRYVTKATSQLETILKVVLAPEDPPEGEAKRRDRFRNGT